MKFKDMCASDAKRLFIIYINFVHINKEMKSLAVWVQSDLKFDLKINVYEVELQVVKSFKIICDQKAKQE